MNRFLLNLEEIPVDLPAVVTLFGGQIHPVIQERLERLRIQFDLLDHGAPGAVFPTQWDWSPFSAKEIARLASAYEAPHAG